MQKQGIATSFGHPDPDPTQAEFAELLGEIEKEPVPERLLELALKLQVALVENRRRREDEADRA